MAYSHITWRELKNVLARRLDDEERVFWSNPELEVYLSEALRTWNSMAFYHRARSSPFNVTTAITDLNTAVPSLLGFTLKDRDLIAAIQYHLLEPPSSQAWVGSGQFKFQDLISAIQRSRNKFLLDTSSVLATSSISSVSTGRVTLSDATIAIRRAAWLQSGTYSPLWREDEWIFDNAPSSGTIPEAYSVILSPPVTLSLHPAPTASGVLDLLLVQAPAPLDPSTGVLLNVPDDLTWAVKWGALYDLLSKEGRAYDPVRAEYCLRRYQEGVQTALAMPSLLRIEINGSPLQLHTFYELDALDPNWQGNIGAPQSAAVESNLLALTPIQSTSVIIDVLQKAPIPASDSDQVQISREHLDVIIDYSAHLAVFKQGGAEFLSTSASHQRFVQAAIEANSRLATIAPFSSDIASQSKKGLDEVPERIN